MAAGVGVVLLAFSAVLPEGRLLQLDNVARWLLTSVLTAWPQGVSVGMFGSEPLTVNMRGRRF